MSVDSRVESVLVHSRGAVVTRAARLGGLPAGEVDVVFSGLPAALEIGSLRASFEEADRRGPRDVVAVDAAWAPAEAAAPKGALLLRLRALAHDLVAIDEEQASLVARRSALAVTVDAGLARSVRREARRGGPALDVQGRIADALAIDALERRETAEIDERLRTLAERELDVQRRFDAARLEATQAGRATLEGRARPSWTVTVRLSAPLAGQPMGQGSDELRVEYVVRAARWWPAHSARFTEGSTRVAWTREALVAQDSGEDWSGVRLALSTGDLVRDVRLPVLKSLRIGRAQVSHARATRRAPGGLDELFAAFDRIAGEVGGSSFETGATAPRPTSRRPAGPTLASIDAILARRALTKLGPSALAAGAMPRSATGGTNPKKSVVAGGPPPPPTPAAPLAEATRGAFGMPPPAPPAMMPMSALRASSAGLPRQRGPAESAAEDERLGVASEPLVDTGDEWLEFHLLVVAASIKPHERGRLVRSDASLATADATERERNIAAIPSPPHARDPHDTIAVFDYRLDASQPLDVPSDAKIHRLALDMVHGAATTAFRVVPREAPEVFRESSFRSSFRGPLLPGPVEVVVDGSLLTTSSLEQAHDAGSVVTLGLGVEERVRAARNVHVYESTAGILGGSTQVDHAITIDVRSALEHAITLDVIDRAPVSDDKDVTVRLLPEETRVVSARPERTAYDQSSRGAPIRGGIRWSLPIAAGGEARIEWAYRVSLPAKSEIVGGNRRE